MQIDGGHLMFRFDGPINQARFSSGYVIIVLVLAIAGTYALSVRSSLSYTVCIAVFLATLWSSLAPYIKRFHDRDKSGWWVLISLVPLIRPLMSNNISVFGAVNRRWAESILELWEGTPRP